MLGFVSSDQVVFADPVTSSSSTSLTLDSTVLPHHNNDAIWFEAQLTKSQRSHTHNDFAASVTVSSSEDLFDTQNNSHTSSVELIEEVKKVMEVENQGDVEILMATSESFVRSERPTEITQLKRKETRQKVEIIEHAASLGQSEHRVKGLKKDLGKSKAQMKTSIVVRKMEESSQMDDSILVDGEQQDLSLSSVIAEEEGSTDGKENVGFDLMEQGVVRKIDFTKDPDYYFIPEKDMI